MMYSIVFIGQLFVKLRILQGYIVDTYEQAITDRQTDTHSVHNIRTRKRDFICELITISLMLGTHHSDLINIITPGM